MARGTTTPHGSLSSLFSAVRQLIEVLQWLRISICVEPNEGGFTFALRVLVPVIALTLPLVVVHQ